ncbi:globin domain-containing protein [Nocardia arizonensis]|uniref:globin domain-containing protein n=1 Tax=Nocardia arizonensis TaxID=1141647 RepID=UPI0006D018F6|nr:globin domain-containing protein [Nocardia arizonensis]
MDIPALQASWRDVEEVGDEAVLYFYSHLFTAHPEVRAMFPISMATQRGRFFAALGRIVSSVDRIGSDPSFVQQLGRDHRKFEVVADHYPAAGASLLATLQYFLGAAWTETLAADWAEAYGVVAKIMLLAAEENEMDAPAWWEAEVVGTDRRSIDVAVVRLRPTRPYEYTPGQSFAVEIPQRPKLWRYYSPANAPRADGTIDLHVQIVAGGQVSTPLARQVAAGETVRMGAPIGTALTVADQFRGDLLMVAGGTGLAPMTAVVEQLDAEWRATGANANVHLFHGVRTQWNLYEHGFLTEMAETRPWFRYTPVVSEEPTFRGATGPVGAVAARAGDWRGYTALVCGSVAMVEHTRDELTGAGLAHTAIRFENFDPSGAADAAPPADTGHEVPTWR